MKKLMKNPMNKSMKSRMKTALFILSLSAFTVTALSGCIVYRIDIQQGNEISAAMVEKLELGMSQREVARLLGEPLVKDPFHRRRWDYYYSKYDGQTSITTHYVTSLLFDEDELSDITSTLQ